VIKVDFYNETEEKVIEEKDLKKLSKYMIKYMGLKNISFSVIFVDNDTIKELNKNYRKIDRVTDVITFRLADYEEVMCGKVNVLGDVYICLDRAKEQAEEYGHSYLRELCFLLVHGFLHLLGYDHMNEEDEKKMFSLQEEILDGYGIKR